MLRRIDPGPAELVAPAEHRAPSGAGWHNGRHGTGIRNCRGFGRVKSVRRLLGKAKRETVSDKELRPSSLCRLWHDRLVVIPYDAIPISSVRSPAACAQTR